MKTKIAYVLASDGNDRYTAMLELSLWTLRRHSPDAKVVVAMDAATRGHLEKRKSSILSDSEPLVVEIPAQFGIMQRSRYLKTTLRETVQGDFLYLDGDTFIADRMDEIDGVESDLAMVADQNKVNLCECSKRQIEQSAAAGFRDPRGEPYFNGGVFLVRDTPANHEFFSMWHSLWQVSLGNGVPQDQPALCETNFRLGRPVKQLSGIWNCQYRYLNNDSYRPYVSRGKVFHYFTAAQEGRLFSFLIDRVKDSGRVDAVAAAVVRWPRLLVREHQLAAWFWKLKRKFR